MKFKRNYVTIEKKVEGIAGKVMTELQVWAKELCYRKCALETGEKMIEAIGLNKKNNFKVIPNYRQYANIKSSICLEKEMLIGIIMYIF